MDDVTAINRLRRGDLSGLTALVERYQLQAVRIAMLITRDRALAEDVVQTTFLRLSERIELVDPGRPFPPYLFRSVVNAAVHAAKREWRHDSLDGTFVRTNGRHHEGESPLDWLPDPSPLPDAAAESAELKREVRAALDRLTPEQRAAVVLRYYLDYSEAEMAEVLAAPAGTIKWRLHQARKRLRVLLKERGS